MNWKEAYFINNCTVSGALVFLWHCANQQGIEYKVENGKIYYKILDEFS